MSKPEKGFDPELFFWCPGTFLFFAFVLHTQQKVPDRRKTRRCLWLWWGAELGDGWDYPSPVLLWVSRLPS